MAGTEMIMSSMQNLCSDAKSLSAVFAMMAILIGIAVFLVGQFWQKKQKILRIVGILILGIAILLIVTYLSIPFILQQLIGQSQYDPCGPIITPSCNAGPNQTCIMYAMKSLS